MLAHIIEAMSSVIDMTLLFDDGDNLHGCYFR